MKTQRGCGLIGWLAAAFALITLAASMTATAADDPGQRVSLSLAAGESYVIDGVNRESTPTVKILDNPHALIVNNGGGRVTLLGAAAGHWAIAVTLDDGTKSTYDVWVKQIANAKKPLAPVKMSALDAGAGPIVASASPKAPSVPSSAEASVTPKAPSGFPSSPKDTTRQPSARPDTWAAPASASAPVPNDRVAEGSATEIAPAAVAAPANQLISNQAAAAAAQASAPRYIANPPAQTAHNPDLESGTVHYLPPDGLLLMANTSQLLEFPCRLRRVSIADTTIADIQVVNPHQINLVAHQTGFTTLTIWDDQGHYEQNQVRVDKTGKQQVLLNVTVAELDRNRLENQGINMSVAFSSLGLSLVGLPGAVASPYSASSSGQSRSTLTSAGSLMPLLLSQGLTYALAAGNHAVQTQTFFQFLEQHNLGRVLAEPHLLANSGEKAEFLSGGEIPIVISQALNTSIVFKQFGTSVAFIPTVVGRDMIELVVSPEVSQPDYAHGVQLFGFTVPAFVTRRARTVVRLHNEQTLIIAGLILNNPTSTVDKVPYLGDLPWLGAIFRTTSYQNAQTDLVMSVTPQIVAPVPAAGEIALPTDRPPLSTDEIKTLPLNQADASRPRL